MSNITASQVKFPKFHIKEKEQNRMAQLVIMCAIRLARQEGSHAAYFGHHKKKVLMQKTLPVMSMAH